MFSHTDNVTTNLPYPTVTKIEGRPSYVTVSELKRQLKANSSSVTTELRGGLHGFLGLILSDAEYQALTGQAWVDPINPGMTAVIQAGTSAADRTQIYHEHKMQGEAWRKFNAVRNVLKQQVVSAVEDSYLKSLENRHTGFAGVTVRAMLGHLTTSYGIVSASDLEYNNSAIRETYDPEHPIENLFDQIEDGMELAEAGGAPYTDAQVVKIAYALVFKTGVFSDSCREWRQQSNPNWARFKVHFQAAYLDLLEETAMQGNSFGNHIMAETAQAINNLTQATIDDRATVLELIRTNSQLTAQLTELQEQVRRICTETPTDRPNRPPRNSSAGRRPLQNPEPNGYCWTHGYVVTTGHSSLTCNSPAEGHVRDATRDNIMGGSVRNRPPE
jgi:hypothetical protein